MSIVLIFLSCFLLYTKSKHFPQQFAKIGKKLKGKERVVGGIAYILFLIAFALMAYRYGLATGGIIFLITLMLGLSLTIMFLPLHKKYAYVLLGLSLLSIVMENIL
ncbi:MAG: hypothetical protein AAF717_07605 [Bacteroidota bacterium]